MALEQYLSELEKKDKLNVDFHNHGQTGDRFRKPRKELWSKIKGLIFDESPKGLYDILEKIKNSRLDVMYLTSSVLPNKDNQRYQQWTSHQELEKARQRGWQLEQGQYYLFAKKQGKIVVLGHSKEIETQKGHIILSGCNSEKISSPDSTESLEKAVLESNDNELLIGEKYNPRLDAVQVDGNFYLPFFLNNWRAKKQARKHNVPLVYNEDGHHPKDIGDTYNIFNSEDLNYNSEIEFRNSIKQAVLGKNFNTRFDPIPPHRILHHIIMTGLNIIRDKYVGWKEKASEQTNQ